MEGQPAPAPPVAAPQPAPQPPRPQALAQSSSGWFDKDDVWHDGDSPDAQAAAAAALHLAPAPVPAPAPETAEQAEARRARQRAVGHHPQCRAACLFSGLSSGWCWQAAEEVRAQVAHKRTELLSDPATDERERKAKAALMTKIEAWLAEDVGKSHAHSRRLASRRVSDTIAWSRDRRQRASVLRSG